MIEPTAMSGWISSKLKVAESFLQQIDKQAAESLKKAETSQIREADNVDFPRLRDTVPLKDQNNLTRDTDDIFRKLNIDPKLNSGNNFDKKKEFGRLPATSKPGFTDGDWTELLSSPNKPASPSTSSHGNGVSMVRLLKRDGRKSGSLSSHLPGVTKKNQKKHNSPKLVEKKGSLSGGLSDGNLEEESKESSKLNQYNDMLIDGKDEECRSINLDPPLDSEHDDNGELFGVLDVNKNSEQNGVLYLKKNGMELHSRDVPSVVLSPLVDEKKMLGSVLELGTIGKSKSGKKAPPVDNDIAQDSSSSNDGRSDSEMDSASTSGSESEQEKVERGKRRQHIMVKRMMDKAVEAIKERENLVARLEGEKESLEKNIEERAKQQAKEASELQKNTMETMNAVEEEKQKHNNTRMELLAQLAKLETANANLARSLASSQWNLDVEINRVAELRQQMEGKQVAHDELKRKISNTSIAGTSLNRLKEVKFEREILEEEYSYISGKIQRLKDKEKALKANIEMTQMEMENESEIEIELKHRLAQLTDHLIQKQAQVESLSLEKATLQFRIEALSNLVNANGSILDEPTFDLESGELDVLKPRHNSTYDAERIQSDNRRYFWSFLRQLDSILCAGAAFVRRSTVARVWSSAYVALLHLWVVYILTTRGYSNSSSGAMVSLEKINDTGGA